MIFYKKIFEEDAVKDPNDFVKFPDDVDSLKVFSEKFYDIFVIDHSSNLSARRCSSYEIIKFLLGHFHLSFLRHDPLEMSDAHEARHVPVHDIALVGNNLPPGEDRI